jgi:hypothetical protein
LGNFVISRQFRHELQNCFITKLQIQESNHGKHSSTNQRRTQEIETRFAQEEQSGEAQEAPRLRARIEKAQGEEVGSRPVETLAAGFGNKGMGRAPMPYSRS